MLRRVAVIAFFVCTASTATAAVADDPPTVTEACGSSYEGLHAQSFWAKTSDGVRLYMAEAGNGKTTVVLAHGGRSDLCETLPFANQLVAAGYRIVALDFRGSGRSQAPSRNRLGLGRDLAAAVAHARGSSAARIFLIGSSMGGAAIVQNTSTLRVAGRVSLSGTRLWPGYGINSPAGVARIRDPFLYVGTRHDGNAPVAEARRIFRRVGARDKRIALYPGSSHGWDIVENGRLAPRARALVLRWLKSRS
jgi:pimeloyl-ACP methyl ester carboxylesterase